MMTTNPFFEQRSIDNNYGWNNQKGWPKLFKEQFWITDQISQWKTSYYELFQWDHLIREITRFITVMPKEVRASTPDPRNICEGFTEQVSKETWYSRALFPEIILTISHLVYQLFLFRDMNYFFSRISTISLQGYRLFLVGISTTSHHGYRLLLVKDINYFPSRISTISRRGYQLFLVKNINYILLWISSTSSPGRSRNICSWRRWTSPCRCPAWWRWASWLARRTAPATSAGIPPSCPTWTSWRKVMMTDRDGSWQCMTDRDR